MRKKEKTHTTLIPSNTSYTLVAGRKQKPVKVFACAPSAVLSFNFSAVLPMDC
ncbi:hypothetical protein [Mucilaginibacter flavidus]|uniref:hypothetical protein n=1 Tax=Mucilaginibacter flavidus TaxID=2949309 RepID=UPI002091EBEB|nr:hypothetical protein [Mucilaginibacter flavidus]MCO5951184.1 hypothetical protein [Mucilaginibacter flavidus]